MNKGPSPVVSSQAHSLPEPAWRALVRIAVAGFCLMFLTAADSTSVALAPAASGTSAGVSAAFLASLTEEERAWLRAHPVIRVVQDPDWPPIEFADERGNPTGMTKDYLTLIEQRLGRKFEPVLHVSWQEALARMKRGEIDMTTTVAETPERLEYLAFTKPYMNIPIVIATQQDVSYIGNLHELAGKKVAAVDGYAVHEWMKKDFPEVRLLKVKTSLEGLQRLQRGEVDAFIDSLVTIGYHQARRDVLNLKIAGATPYTNTQRMAVRKDWVPLAGILQKALESISAAERDEIFRRWLPIRYEHGVDYTRLWPAAAFLALVLIGLGLWNWKLAAEIRLRKQTGETLRHTQALLASAETIGRVGGWEIDVQTRQTTWTEGVYDIYELDGTDRLTVDEGINYYTPASRPIIEQAVQRTIEQGEPFDLELEIITAKGNRRSVHAVGKPDLPRGKVSGFFQDITERKQAQIASEAAHSQLQATLDALPDLLFEVDAEGRIFSYHTHRSDLLAAPPEVFMGMRFADVLPPEAASACQRAIDEAAQNGSSNGETLWLTLPQGGRWFELSVAPLHTAAKSGQHFIMISRDITERKQAEAGLQKFSMLAESSSEFIGMCDRELTPYYVNPAGLRMVGLPDLAAACAVKVQDYFFPEDQRFIAEEFFPRVLREGSGDVEIRLRHFQTGEPIWVYYYLFSVHDASGENVGWATVSRDITERKRAETCRIESEKQRSSEQAAALEVQRQAGIAALSLMEDALAARRQAEAMSATLKEQLNELHRWQKAMFGREGRVMEMKKEVNSLLVAHGQPPRYPSVVDAEAEK